MHKKIMKLIRRVEEMIGAELPIDWIEVDNSILGCMSGLFTIDDKGEIQITIGSKLKGKKLKQVVLHEIGHVIEELKFPKKYLKPFKSETNSYHAEGLYYTILTSTWKLWMLGEVPKGFVSHYARASASEDFAECFSFLIMYPEEKPADIGVAKKLESIKKILDYIKHNT